MPQLGIVRPSAPVPGASGHVVGVDLDVAEHRFLRDHMVDGKPLLSTVMGIETIACAARALRPGAVITEVTDVRVGPPYFAAARGTGRVEVSMIDVPGAAGSSSPARTLHCELRDPLANDPRTVHLAADVSLAETLADVTPADVTPSSKGRGPGGGNAVRAVRAVQAAAIYDLFFHGESFRVVDSAWFDDDGFVGRLARDLPPIVDPDRSSMMAPLLIELCLQTAGLRELAETGRMMIPRGIDRIVRHTSADSSTAGLRAVVTPGFIADPPGEYCFDAAVVGDNAGGGQTVHMTVQGYRTTEFAHPHDVEAAARISDALAEPRPSR